MKNEKTHTSSKVLTNFYSDITHVSFNAFLPEGKLENSLPELNPKFAALHSAHKGMHPVLFTVLAALHETFNNHDTITNNSQGKSP